MGRSRLPELSLTEWAVLALTAEQHTHGFAVSKELAPDGDARRIWTVPRPLVYRALATLERDRLVEPLGAEAGDQEREGRGQSLADHARSPRA
jgi:DNA-binding PadR family transcriptional regulator